MTKELLEKISKNRSPLDINDISAAEKSKIQHYLWEKGFSMTTFYLRFFHKGFYPWEIFGVTECKRRFLELPEVASSLLDYIAPEDVGHNDGNKGYMYILAQSDEPGVFYDCLRKVNQGLCLKFCNFMSELGMSAGTAAKRFSEENWKEWECDGIRKVLESYMAQEQK